MKRVNQLNSLFLDQFYVFELILTLKKSQNFNLGRYFGIPKNDSFFIIYTHELENAGIGAPEEATSKAIEVFIHQIYLVPDFVFKISSPRHF